MDDFILFLVGGMLILAAMLLVFSGLQFTEGVFVPTGEFRDFINDSGDKIGIVGPVGVDTLRLIDLGTINVSFIKTSKTIGVGAKDIHNGLLFGSSSVRYTLDEVDELEIIFNVDSTNDYAPLQIKVNGNIVAEDRFSEGEHRVAVDKALLGQQNIIEISALSSSWRIWAPALYRLSEVKFAVKSLSQKSSRFSFSLDKEYDTFKSGKLDLALDDSIGTFIAEMNGRTIHSGAVSNLQTISFGKADLGRNNTLLLRAGLNSKFFGRAVMRVIYVAEKENILVFPFNVSEADYNRFTTGFIEFKVVSVARKGGINVRIEKDSQVLLNEYDSVTEKTYRYIMRKSNVRPGVNQLVIRSVDGAVFAVTTVQIVF